MGTVMTFALVWGASRNPTPYRISLCTPCASQWDAAQRGESLGEIIEDRHVGLCHECEAGFLLNRRYY